MGSNVQVRMSNVRIFDYVFFFFTVDFLSNFRSPKDIVQFKIADFFIIYEVLKKKIFINPNNFPNIPFFIRVNLENKADFS
jgi:hypothetical protein